jgi:hypothetical protein
MSSDMRKKWRSYRKKRNITNSNNIEYSLRSNKIDEIEKENVCDEPVKKEEINNTNDNNIVSETDQVLDFLINKSSHYNEKDNNNNNDNENVSSDEMVL